MGRKVLVGPAKRKLNLGAGKVLLPGYFNFDLQRYKNEDGSETDSPLGRIEDILQIFCHNWFEEILASHVIEHFYYTDAIRVLKDCFALLKKGGRLVLEGPDILAMYDIYKGDPRTLIAHIFGGGLEDKKRLKYGDHMAHKSGWTKQILAEEMEFCGYVIEFIGEGITHVGSPHPPENKGRDFRVIGVKP